MLAVPVMLPLLTAGCEMVRSEPAVRAVTVCPQIVEYSLEDQGRAWEELQYLPVDGIVRSRYVPDYSRVRDQIRAACPPTLPLPPALTAREPGPIRGWDGTSPAGPQ